MVVLLLGKLGWCEVFLCYVHDEMGSGIWLVFYSTSGDYRAQIALIRKIWMVERDWIGSKLVG
jgi:hypothetical protein